MKANGTLTSRTRISSFKYASERVSVMSQPHAWGRPAVSPGSMQGGYPPRAFLMYTLHTDLTYAIRVMVITRKKAGFVTGECKAQSRGVLQSDVSQEESAGPPAETKAATIPRILTC